MGVSSMFLVINLLYTLVSILLLVGVRKVRNLIQQSLITNLWSRITPDCCPPGWSGQQYLSSALFCSVLQYSAQQG